MDLQALFERTERVGSKKIIDGLRTLTYGELNQKCKQIHAFLGSNNIVSGDRIGIASSDEIEVCALILSCLRLGLPVALIDPGAKKPEATKIIDRLQLKSLFLDQGLVAEWSPSVPFLFMMKPKKNKLISRLLGKKRVESPKGSQSYPECLDEFDKATQALPETIPLETPALLLCTSGTTALPKILQLSLKNLLAAAKTTSNQLGFDADTRVLNLLPLTHYDGVISGLFTTFCNAATLIRLGHFSISLLPDIFDAVYKYRATHLLITPSILGLMLRLGEVIRESFQTEDFRFVVSVAATLPPKLWSDFHQLTDKKIVNVYGLSETGNNLFAGPDEESYQIGSIGKPVDCQATILSESGEKAKAGDTGELLLEGASITSGYLDESITTKFMDGVTWFPTGDLAYCDDAGVYWLVGRKKNIIIVGGRNVHPDEINNALLSHPFVIEAATLGFADEIWGERVVSCVVTKDGITSSELIQYATKYLTDYKIPREIHILTELPKGRSGKVLLNELANRLKEKTFQNRETTLAGLEEQVVRLASESFRTPSTELSMKTAPASCSKWDSVAHMDFVTNLEKKFAVELLPREVIQITTLEAAVQIIRNKLTLTEK